MVTQYQEQDSKWAELLEKRIRMIQRRQNNLNVEIEEIQAEKKSLVALERRYLKMLAIEQEKPVYQSRRNSRVVRNKLVETIQEDSDETEESPKTEMEQIEEIDREVVAESETEETDSAQDLIDEIAEEESSPPKKGNK